MAQAGGLTVAVTGPTGDRQSVHASPRKRTLGRPGASGWPAALRPARPADKGRVPAGRHPRPGGSVDAARRGADVVVHLAFLILGSPRGDRASTSKARATSSRRPSTGCQRLVYTSSVAAYGFHDDNPDVLTEDIPPAAARALLLRPEGGAREALFEPGRRRRHRRLRLPPVHRRGTDATRR